MNPTLEVANDVYNRYGISWSNFPNLVTPSAHDDKMELLCAQLSLAVYAAYPSAPHAPEHDYVPSRSNNAIASRSLNLGLFMRGIGDRSPSFEAISGYREVVSDRAAALAAWKDNHLVVAFRGTANWQDWIHNFGGGVIAPECVDTHLAELHKGFFGLAENVFPAVTELAVEFCDARRGSTKPTLTLCGHSLGGALALHFAAMLQKRHHYAHWDELKPRVRIGATYTFGAPRLGKAGILDYIHRPHYRLIVRGDPVPSMPFGFRPDYEATYLEEPTLAPVQSHAMIWRVLKAARTKLLPALSFSAHNIESYIDAIELKIEAKKGVSIRHIKQSDC